MSSVLKVYNSWQKSWEVLPFNFVLPLTVSMLSEKLPYTHKIVNWRTNNDREERRDATAVQELGLLKWIPNSLLSVMFLQPSKLFLSAVVGLFLTLVNPLLLILVRDVTPARYNCDTSCHLSTGIKKLTLSDKDSHVFKKNTFTGSSPNCKNQYTSDCFKILDSAT